MGTIVEFNNRKFNYVQPEELSLAHLMTIDKDLKSLVHNSINEKGELDIDNIFTDIDEYTTILKILPLIYLNENEETFVRKTYQERLEFFESVILTDGMLEAVGEFMVTWGQHFIKIFQKSFNKSQK